MIYILYYRDSELSPFVNKKWKPAEADFRDVARMVKYACQATGGLPYTLVTTPIIVYRYGRRYLYDGAVHAAPMVDSPRTRDNIIVLIESWCSGL